MAQTRLSPRLVTLLDEGRLDELPAGLYARSAVRVFATAIGIDPDAAVARLEPFLPRPPDPLAAMRQSLGCPAEAAPLAADLDRVWSALRSRARTSLARSHATPLRVVGARSASACIDTLLLVLLNALLLGAAAWFSGVSMTSLVESSGAVATFCAVTWVSYYVLLGGVTQTAGAWMCFGPQDREDRPLRAGAILRRAGRVWFDQASIIVDVALYADPAPVKSLLSRFDVMRRRAA